jgi:anti-anti-sigma regulatory factor
VLSRPQLPTAGKTSANLPPQRVPLEPVEELELYLKLFDHLPFMMILTEQESDGEYRCMALNRMAKEASGAHYEGSLLRDVMKSRELKYLQGIFERCLETGDVVIEEVVRPHAQRKRAWYAHLNLPIVSEDRRAILSVAWDITAEKERERLQREAHQKHIERYTRRIDELATPLLRISQNSLVMPLIGLLDERRMHKLIRTLLEGVAQQRVAYVIIDITGVPLIDEQIARSLVRAAQAVRLLGAEIVLSGIRPEVAQTLGSIDGQLISLRTTATLQAAIAQTSAAQPDRYKKGLRRG